MSKEAWLRAHEDAVNEYLDEHPFESWTQAYESQSVAKRADAICADRHAAAIDEARDRAKYEAPEDRPYGPTNPDYEYDRRRQEEVDGGVQADAKDPAA